MSGAGHTSAFAMLADSVSIRGELKLYNQQANSGNTVTNGFCATCGCPIIDKSSGYLELIFIHAGSLDDPCLYHPQKVVWSASRQPWDYIDPSLEAQ